MSSASTLPAKKQGSQLSTMAIRELMRAATPDAIAKIVELSHSKNPNVALGACNSILDRVLPKLTKNEMVDENGEQLFIPLIKLTNALYRNNGNNQDSPAHKED